MKIFPHQELTKSIIGIYYDVYNELGYGFLEKVYHNAMIIELKKRGFEIDNQKKLNVLYKNEIVGEYIPDIIVNNKVILEFKTVEYLLEIHENQLLNYLKATDCEVGIILNFGKDPQFIRKIFTNDLKKNKF
ncbi:GxxExxY protein [Flavobacterium macrobrachii]|jgi:GxxExxY protein|uniref:GxxExxY protein n=1 Tax=Flavobacterium macrobrachii TaxID=591204 RepID=A0ABS2CWK3_9FLAO|nr:GxxExxY protein [Flavobacterium macrobrachii]MBM6499306.1 GxxExxY protein [Flavobacterium macrobrachii]PZO29486.1 MAG: GxxExxY protein [Flavobacteriaceae bacterium]